MLSKPNRHCTRTFVLSLLVLGCLFIAPLVADEAGVDADIVLQNGELYLGDGETPTRGNLAIREDKIIAVGEFPIASAKIVVDCSDLIICPGFIDLHNHSDDEVLEKETRSLSNFLTQGCTTVVTGNCGSGPIQVEDYYNKIDALGAGVNIAHLLPQGDLRREVMGTANRPASTDELQQMCELAEQAMRDGAWGMSTGLIYVPSSYADTSELAAIASVVAKYSGFYASHIRNEGLGLLDSVQEALEIGKRGQLPVHISHFKSSGKDSWGLVRTAVEMIEQSRRAGQLVTADQYPYTASSTSLSATVIPAWARAGGREAMLARLEVGHAESESIYQAIRNKITLTDNGHRIQVAAFDKHPDWAGRRLDEIARAQGMEPFELVLQIERAGGASIVNHSIDESDVQFVMQRPWVATASDGAAKVFNSTVPHPRNYGTFPRKIGFYSHQQQVLPMEQAIRSSTGLPADILGMQDRGYLRVGYVADVAVISLPDLIDRSTFEQPHQYSDGLVHLLVNGSFAIARGRATGSLSGKALRKNSHSALTATDDIQD